MKNPFFSTPFFVFLSVCVYVCVCAWVRACMCVCDGWGSWGSVARSHEVFFSKVWKYKLINFFVFRIATGFHAVNKFRSDILCSPFQFNCGKCKSIWFYLPRGYQLWSHWVLPQHLVCWSNPLGVHASLWIMDHAKSLSSSIFFLPKVYYHCLQYRLFMIHQRQHLYLWQRESIPYPPTPSPYKTRSLLVKSWKSYSEKLCFLTCLLEM